MRSLRGLGIRRLADADKIVWRDLALGQGKDAPLLIRARHPLAIAPFAHCMRAHAANTLGKVSVIDTVGVEPIMQLHAPVIPQYGYLCQEMIPNMGDDACAKKRKIPVMGNNLKALRKDRGWTQAQAAAEFGMSKSGYVKIEDGDRKLTDRHIAKAAEVYGISEADILAQRTTVPLVGYVGAGAEAHFYGTGDGNLDEAPPVDGMSADTVAVEIRGDSLGSFFDHWLVYYDDRRSPITADLIGHLCVVGLRDERVLVKKIKRSSTRGLYHLYGQFGDPILDVAIEWAARVKNMVPR